MRRFDYQRVHSVEAAVRAAQQSSTHKGPAARVQQAAQFIAGGTNMVDYMTLEVVQPSSLIDINPLQQELSEIDATAQRLRLGALVRMSEAEDHATVRKDYPVIQQSLLLAASRQIRNRASLGGNVLQHTRCEYFRETSWPCNRRAPGSGCAAMDGINRQHAILGTSDQCIAAYPGDFAQALIALDAFVETIGAEKRRRRFPFAELHRVPGDTPYIENTLAPGELITAFEVPAGPWTRRSCYVKVRDRQSYQFALTSAAVALHMEGDTVRVARIALGGVGSVPWRAHDAEAVLKNRTLDEALAHKAAEAAFASAQPRTHNRFKVSLGQQTLIRALLEARAVKVLS